MWDSTMRLLWFQMSISMLYCAALPHFISTVKQETQSLFAIIYFLGRFLYYLNKIILFWKNFAPVHWEHGCWACWCSYADYTLIADMLCNIWGTVRIEISREYTSNSPLPVALTYLFQSMLSFISARVQAFIYWPPVRPVSATTKCISH